MTNKLSIDDAVGLADGTSELLALAHQYRDDLRYPPSPDSCQRRLAAIDAAIAKASDTRAVDTVGVAKRCRVCGGEGWVCENHADRPWAGVVLNGDACGCGAGQPCGACNLAMASAGFVETGRARIVAWLRATPACSSGWNPHDEQYDAGHKSAIDWVVEALENRADQAATS